MNHKFKKGESGNPAQRKSVNWAYRETLVIELECALSDAKKELSGFAFDQTCSFIERCAQHKVTIAILDLIADGEEEAIKGLTRKIRADTESYQNYAKKNNAT